MQQETKQFNTREFDEAGVHGEHATHPVAPQDPENRQRSREEQEREQLEQEREQLTSPGRLTAAGDQGPTTLFANSEEGVDSPPHSSNATELGDLVGEQRVRNREHLATSQHTVLHASCLRILACTSPAPRLHLTALLACAAVTYKTELCAR